MAVLFPILFQTLHSYEHHSEDIVAKNYNFSKLENNFELSTDHSISEKCIICNFNLSSFTTTDFYVFQFHENGAVAHYPKFYFKNQFFFFKGSLFSLRAPPIF